MLYLSKKIKKRLKNRIGGITLISLVVTIIILLILAGVSIATLTGDNGILSKTSESKEQTEKGKEKEGVGLAITRAQISDTGYSEPTQENLQIAIDEQFGNGQATVINNGDGTFTVKFHKNNRKYEITSQYGIKEQTQVTDTTPGELIGNGDETSPYLIESIEDLVYFANSVSNGNKYESKYIKLVNDLDFTSDYSYIEPYRENYLNYSGKLKTALTSGEGFKTIGSIENRFYGNFDGNNKKIYGLYINKTGENSFHLGFFAGNFGIIKNLTMVDSNIYGNSVQNPVIGNISSTNSGKIKNCNSSGSITGIGNTWVIAGGITGILESNGIIENCSNSTNVNSKNIGIESGDAVCGGIVGQSSSGSQYIKGCVNKGKLEVSCNNFDMHIGGIIGYSRNEIIDCYNLSNIEVTTNNIIHCGGITGYNDQNKISNCYNKGNLKIVNNGAKVLQ